MFEVKRNPSRSEIRRFGWVMLAGFAVLGVLSWYLGIKPFGGFCPDKWGWMGNGWHRAAIGFAIAGGLFVAVCLLWYSAGRHLYVVWMSAGMLLGLVTTTVLLTVIFFLFLPVFALIRIKDPLRLRLGGTGSYWEEHRSEETTLQRMERPF